MHLVDTENTPFVAHFAGIAGQQYSDSSLTALIAVNSVRVVISRMLHEKGLLGTSLQFFLPAIQGTETCG